MEHLAQADAEMARGRFNTALEHLAELRPRQRSRHYLPYNLSTAEALQLTGQNERARRLASAGLRATDRTRITDARCLTVLARAAFDDGFVKRSAQLFRKARAAAERVHDGELTARILLDMLASVADWLPASDAARLVNQCERAATYAGHPHAAAQFHGVVAEQQVRAGRLDQAASHLRMGETFLRASPNVWLKGQLHLARAMLHAFKRESVAGALQARKALACGRQSGHADTLDRANAELARIHLLEGRFRQAARRCRDGLEQASESFAVRVRLLDLLAQVELARGHWQACETLLSRMRDVLPRDGGLHPSHHNIAVLISRARLQLQRREWRAALATCEAGATVAEERNDRLQGSTLRILAADALLEMERPREAAERIDQAAQHAGEMTIAVRTQIERARAALLARTAGPETARRRFEIALRVLAVEGETGSRMDAASSYLRTMQPADEQLRRQIRNHPANLEPLIENSLAGAGSSGSGQSVLSGGPVPLAHAVPLIDLAERATLLAREVFVLLRESGCTAALAVIEQRDKRITGVHAYDGWTSEQAAQAARKPNGAVILPVGRANGCDLSVVVEPRGDTWSQAVVRDVRAVVEGARMLESIRVRERGKLPLWLPDLPPARDDGVFASPAMTRLLARARRIAASDEPVLIVGETGTGKEVVARFIHKYSSRAQGEFTAFNCAEVPAGMAESVFFGHRSGAYTGATRDYGGVIRGAQDGTLLLDEIADLESSVQPKLLRFLDRGDVHPLGAQKPVHVDVRIIVATNPAIDQRMRDGSFREDLYFRLNIMRLDVPPLRARRAEIPVLVHHFLRRFGAARGMPNLTVTDDVLDALYRHNWPGNVRQLENHVRRLAALATDDVVTASGLTAADSTSGGNGGGNENGGAEAETPLDPAESNHLPVRTDQPLADAVAQVEHALIRRALAEAGGNAAAAARTLGVSRRGLQLKRRRLGIGEIDPPKA